MMAAPCRTERARQREAGQALVSPQISGHAVNLALFIIVRPWKDEEPNLDQ